LATVRTEVDEMLVLSRKESQRIRLGDQIVITIVKISGDKVRVGIDAPPDVLVLRDELEPRTRPMGEAADAPTTGDLRRTA
jgi:carbon storage regulator